MPQLFGNFCDVDELRMREKAMQHVPVQEFVGKF